MRNNNEAAWNNLLSGFVIIKRFQIFKGYRCMADVNKDSHIIHGIEDEKGLKTSNTTGNDLPFAEADDAFSRKKPINLFITIFLAFTALVFAIVISRHYFQKINEEERLKWENGRLEKEKLENEKSKQHDLFQPLRKNWTSYITSHIATANKKEAFIILENKSPKVLDKVVVSIFYLNWNSEASNVENLVFDNIKPSEIRKSKVPSRDSAKGVTCIIKSIRASSFSFCFDTNMETEGKPDPYYCSNP